MILAHITIVETFSRRIEQLEAEVQRKNEIITVLVDKVARLKAARER
jgi:hypothetical protein